MAGTKAGADKQRELYGDDIFSRRAREANKKPRRRGYDDPRIAKLAAYKRWDPEKYEQLKAELEVQNGTAEETT